MIVIQDKEGIYLSRLEAFSVWSVHINAAKTYKTIEAAASDVAYLKKLGYDCEWKEIKATQ